MVGRQMKLGFLTHAAGMTKWTWRQPSLPSNASVNFDFFLDLVKRAEAAKFDFFFYTDSPYCDANSSPYGLSHLEPVSLLSGLASVTSEIGLVATMSTSYTEPYNLARQIGSLDVMSGGRAGWNAVTTAEPGAGLNYGLDESLSHAERYARATEFIQVVRGLWDSWEDDAFVYDKARRLFADTSKLHRLDFQGEHFKVRGPLNLQRSRQGQPVVFQAGASGAGQAFAAQFADAIFGGTRSLKEAQAYYAAVKEKAKTFERRAEPLMMVAIGAFVGSTDEEAERLYKDFCELVTPDEALGYLSWTFGGFDFSQYDPNAPFPELDETAGKEAYQSAAARFKSYAKANGLTLLETAMRVATPRPQFVGGPERVADALVNWFETRAADGFILGLGTPAQGIANFIELVVPVLRRRGYFRTEYEGSTLREHLGLPHAENTHSRRTTGVA
ncbi:MAG: NtaA/DmoA family FMN-dependent monooxygenase [Caulobacteraceae bacterium]|nr:NtaA/DmoA family FMN-dependent monooxygenase [Caulobacteraceae bacterium]